MRDPTNTQGQDKNCRVKRIRNFDSMPMGVTESPAYVSTQLGRYKAMVQAAGAQAD